VKKKGRPEGSPNPLSRKINNSKGTNRPIHEGKMQLAFHRLCQCFEEKKNLRGRVKCSFMSGLRPCNGELGGSHRSGIPPVSGRSDDLNDRPPGVKDRAPRSRSLLPFEAAPTSGVLLSLVLFTHPHPIERERKKIKIGTSGKEGHDGLSKEEREEQAARCGASCGDEGRENETEIREQCTKKRR